MREAAVRIPHFSSAGAKARDYDPCTRGGAEILIDRLKKMWASHGWKVEFRIIEIGTGATGGGGVGHVCCIRSDLINGMPRRRLT